MHKTNPMVKIIKSVIVFTMGFLCLYSPAASSNSGQGCPETVYSDCTAGLYEGNEIKSPVESENSRESLFPDKSHSLAFSHFTWGAEAGSSLDLTSHDLSSFDIDVLIGYKNSFIHMAGIGAGIHRSIHSGNNFIPVYAVVRTNFRRTPSLFFLNLQGGYSFNSLSESTTVGDFYGALGLGINLQQTRTSRTYVIISGAYQYFNERNKLKTDIDTSYIFFAKLVVGINF